jgi:uronate dehydrogenase
VQTILITGAAGRIGSLLRQGLAGPGRILRLTDVTGLGAAGRGEQAEEADLADLGRAIELCDGVNAAIHLAGLVRPDLGWDETLRNNIVTTYNVFEAARVKGVRRVVFASSIHAHGFVPRATRLSADTPYRPDGLYGLAKVFGEATGRLYADKHALEVVCLRIASFRPEPSSERELGTWLSPRDAVQLFARALDSPGIHYLVAYGVSANARALYDRSGQDRLGFSPADDSADHAARIGAIPGAGEEPELERRFHGAHYVSAGFAGDLDRID